MNQTQHKLIDYLNEAHATEQAVTRELQSQIAMAPEGSYRSGLERHLDETRDHARRVGARLKDLGQGANPLTAVVGLAESVLGQVVALGKAPWNLVRGSGGDEKVLQNAKDACAIETREIATYTAIERLARAAGDDETATLAASIRADEEQMLQRIMGEIPRLTEAVVDAEPADDRSTNGAGEARQAPKNGARKTTAATKRTARRTRKVSDAKPDPDSVIADELGAAAAAGDGAAAFALWERLRDSDAAAAEGWLRTAADLGEVRGAHRLGLLLWRERSDGPGAVAWLDRAAQADHPAAQRDLGFVLREQGDVHGAHYWLNRAAGRDDEARHALAELG